jgi:hypothetical protein
VRNPIISAMFVFGLGIALATAHGVAFRDYTATDGRFRAIGAGKLRRSS